MIVWKAFFTGFFFALILMNFGVFDATVMRCKP